MTGNMPGRKTFTATSRSSPVLLRKVAKCTCAMEALATGSRSKVSKMSSTERLKARSIEATAMDELKGGTRSCSLASSSAMSGASKSRRVDSTWPNFTKIGPNRSSASRRRTARGERKSRPTDSTRASRRIQGF